MDRIRALFSWFVTGLLAIGGAAGVVLMGYGSSAPTAYTSETTLPSTTIAHASAPKATAPRVVTVIVPHVITKRGRVVYVHSAPTTTTPSGEDPTTTASPTTTTVAPTTTTAPPPTTIPITTTSRPVTTTTRPVTTTTDN